MATFTLIHGSFHGGWCWDKIVPRLSDAGHQAIAPDLPGMGADQTPFRNVTLEMTGQFIAELVQRQPERPILVGHSLGGVAISAAAERAPDAIKGLVYVSAILLPNGGSAIGVMGNRIPPGISQSRDRTALTIDPEYARAR